uniref:Hypothetical conserved protein n=1 Tax=Acetithermum autotrophicum TaxID=1446466 RepID=H5STJ0_ACEAU|nr:hypothetical conserved protein [Candidatus Acetothermum autotrophicum]
MNVYTIRLERLRDNLRRKRLDGFCLVNVEGSDRSNLYYLTGFAGSFGVLIVTKDQQLFLTDSRYITRAKEIVSDYTVRELKGRVTTVATRINRLKLKTIAINGPTTSTWLFHQLRDKLKENESSCPWRGWSRPCAPSKTTLKLQRLSTPSGSLIKRLSLF